MASHTVKLRVTQKKRVSGVSAGYEWVCLVGKAEGRSDSIRPPLHLRKSEDKRRHQERSLFLSGRPSYRAASHSSQPADTLLILRRQKPCVLPVRRETNHGDKRPLSGALVGAAGLVAHQASRAPPGLTRLHGHKQLLQSPTITPREDSQQRSF